ncbi:MAG: class I SAM-dependent methyltransferase [Eudoraea sp.]|nr:class I SAM-dependent methyltransferase [Eudoraea sp.]
MYKVKEKIAIHETAFVTSAFRASDTDLSKDSYARLWPNSKTTKHAHLYAEKVSEYEPFAHCLRNRYFFETLKRLSGNHKIEYLINFGCGFSMYPFMLPKGLKHIEIDKSDVIAYKKDQIGEWVRNNKLPFREVQYIASDFNNVYLEDLLAEIKTILKGATSFILIEGVLFFLGADDTARLFDIFNAIQRPGDYIGSVSFTPQLEKTKVFQKLISYVESNLDKNEQFDYQTIGHDYYTSMEHYELIDHQDTINLAKFFAQNKPIEPKKVLNEHMYLLKKIK